MRLLGYGVLSTNKKKVRNIVHNTPPYNLSMEKHVMAKIGQYVLILQNGKILLLKRAGSDSWSLPGGRLNEEDTPREAVKREIEEETGLSIDNLHPYEVLLLKDRYQTKYSVFFTCNVINVKEIILSEEHSEYDFFARDQLENFKDIDDSIEIRNMLVKFLAEKSS